MEMNALPVRKGYNKPAKRVGRGIGSGKGVRCTFGNKGSKARAGRTKRIGFEGGQTPFYRRMPKFRGFKTLHPFDYATVTLNTLSIHFNDNDIVTTALLKEKQLIHPLFKSFKVVATGELAKTLIIKGQATKAALKIIEEKGGKVEVA